MWYRTSSSSPVRSVVTANARGRREGWNGGGYELRVGPIMSFCYTATRGDMFDARMATHWSVLASCLIGLYLILPASAQSAQTEPDRGGWRTAAPAPTKRTEVAAVTSHDKIYVIGGVEPPGLGNVLTFAITPAGEEYDPSADRWTSKKPMPVGLHHVGIGVAGGRIYVIGGYKHSGFSVWQAVATVYAFDPSTDTWTERAAMPTP